MFITFNKRRILVETFNYMIPIFGISVDTKEGHLEISSLYLQK